MVARGLVISELAPEGPADPDDEFVELYNPTTAAIALAGYSLEYSSAANPTTFNSWHLFTSGSIPSHGFYAVGKLASSAWDVTANGTYLMGGAGGTIRLVQGGSSVVDQLGWGTGASEGSSAPAPNGNASLERKARSGSTASSMSFGEDQLFGNSYDSNNNASDFVNRSLREPQTSAAREP
jgi:hypothetical protein